MAAEARALGLPWTRATIAALETGRRELSLGEAWLLPWIYGVELPELLNATHVQIAPTVTMPGQLVRASARGEALKAPVGTWAAEPSAASGDVAERLVRRALDSKQLARVWPDASEPDLEAASADAAGEVETRAGRRLGVEPMALALAARRRWHQSLTEERDYRTPEGVTSRGHITRALLNELRPDLEAAGLLKPQRRRSRKES